MAKISRSVSLETDIFVRIEKLRGHRSFSSLLNEIVRLGLRAYEAQIQSNEIPPPRQDPIELP